MTHNTVHQVKDAAQSCRLRARLRHFYASALIAANMNPKIVQARLGHATITETMGTYGHLFPDAEDLGRAAGDEALAPVLAEQSRNRTSHDRVSAVQG
jgi:integrase